MKADFEKRLQQLERQIKAAGERPVWIDGRNAQVRVDVGGKRGQPLAFPSACEMRLWLEKQIDAHAGGRISYVCDNVADLHEDAQELRSALKDIIPGQIVVPDRLPRVKNGEIVWEEKPAGVNHPQVYSADHLPGILAMGKMTAGYPADLRLWCLASLIEQYFGNQQFKARWLEDRLIDDDNRMFFACLALFAWKREGREGEIYSDFLALMCQEASLTLPDAGEKS